MERENRGHDKFVSPDKFVIHPDVRDLTQSYKGDPQHFKKGFEKRDELLAQGEPFWDTSHDEEMLETARENTDNFIAKTGKKFPQRRKR